MRQWEMTRLSLADMRGPGMRRKGTNKKGFVLLLSIVIMIVLSAIVGGLIVSLTADTRNLAVQRNDAKAFWIAEAGVAHAVKQLLNGDITLTVGASSSIAITSFGGGTYSVTLTRPVDDIVITATGTYGSQSRQVTQSETVATTTYFPYAFSYAVFGTNSGGTTFKVGNNNSAEVVISGDLYYDGTVDVKNDSSVVDGVVYADSIIGGGTYTPGVGDPDPIPTYPSFSTATYDTAITTADSSASSNLTVSGSTNLNLAGATVYYETVTIKDDATITGPGTIVATKAVTIKDDAIVGTGVHFISKKDITIQNDAVVQSGGSYYSREDIIVKNDANVTSALITTVNDKQVKVMNDAVFEGIIFTDKANIQDDAVVNGSIVANEFASNQIANNATVTHDPDDPDDSYLPSTVTTGFTPRNTYTYAKAANSWAEI